MSDYDETSKSKMELLTRDNYETWMAKIEDYICSLHHDDAPDIWEAEECAEAAPTPAGILALRLSLRPCSPLRGEPAGRLGPPQGYSPGAIAPSTKNSIDTAPLSTATTTATAWRRPSALIQGQLPLQRQAAPAA